MFFRVAKRIGKNMQMLELTGIDVRRPTEFQKIVTVVVQFFVEICTANRFSNDWPSNAVRLLRSFHVPSAVHRNVEQFSNRRDPPRNTEQSCSSRTMDRTRRTKRRAYNFNRVSSSCDKSKETCATGGAREPGSR